MLTCSFCLKTVEVDGHNQMECALVVTHALREENDKAMIWLAKGENLMSAAKATIDALRAALLEQGETIRLEGEPATWCCCGNSGSRENDLTSHTGYCLRAQRALGMIP